MYLRWNANYIKEGKIRNPRRGIYTKATYDKKEMACSLYRPAYISLEIHQSLVWIQRYVYSPSKDSAHHPSVSVFESQVGMLYPSTYQQG